MTLALLRRGVEPLHIGHRGAPALAPENTIASFECALKLGADGVELDVVCPDSRGLAVCHGLRGSGPPLDDVLEFLADRDAVVQVHLKTIGHERLLIEAVRRFDLLERTVVSSSRSESLRAAAAFEPRLARSFTYPEDRFGSRLAAGRRLRFAAALPSRGASWPAASEACSRERRRLR